MTTPPLPREEEVFACVLAAARQYTRSPLFFVTPTTLMHMVPLELKHVLSGEAGHYLRRMTELGLAERCKEFPHSVVCRVPLGDAPPGKEHRTMVIHKYPLRFGGEANNISMPRGAQLLHVAAQETPVYAASVCVWALVDPEERMVTRQFLIVGTGHPVPAGKYVGTALMDGGALVWHVFDRGEVLLTRTGGPS